MPAPEVYFVKVSSPLQVHGENLQKLPGYQSQINSIYSSTVTAYREINYAAGNATQLLQDVTESERKCPPRPVN